MRFSKVIPLLLLASALWSDDSCTVLQVAQFTPDQITKARPLAYGVAQANGLNQVPTSNLNGTELTLCFNDVVFDTTLISTTSLVNFYSNNPASLTTLTGQINSYETELSTTTAAIIAAYPNFNSLTQTQINQGVKMIVRVLWLRQLLGLL
jgi:hypothetical protein